MTTTTKRSYRAANNVSSQRLDFTHDQNKYWYKFEVDKQRLGKKCYFKDCRPHKPIYAIGHAAHMRRTIPKFVPAKDIKMLTESTDIVGKVRDKLSFGEIQPMFMVGPNRGPIENKLNTFNNLFGGSLESTNSISSIKSIESPTQPISPPERMSKRTMENLQTKSRVLMGLQQSVVPSMEPVRTGLKMVPNKNKYESDYWSTTFRRTKGASSVDENSSVDSLNEKLDGKEEGLVDRPESRGIFTPAPVGHIYKCPPSCHGRVTKILRRLIEEDERPIEPGELPLHLQGLKRSENGWFRKLMKNH